MKLSLPSITGVDEINESLLMRYFSFIRGELHCTFECDDRFNTEDIAILLFPGLVELYSFSYQYRNADLCQ